MSISTSQSCRSGLAHLTPVRRPNQVIEENEFLAEWTGPNPRPPCDRTVLEASIHAGLRPGGVPKSGRTVQVFESAASAALEMAPHFRKRILGAPRESHRAWESAC